MKKLMLLSIFGFGMYFIISSGYMILKAELSHYFIKEAWQKTLKSKQFYSPWSWADTFPILRISAPRISKSSYVLEGASGRNMAFSAVRLATGGMPGDLKTTVISGHNDSHFRYLKELKIGDKIITQDKMKSHVYKITNIEVIDSNKEKISIRNANEIILTTCYPFSALQYGGVLRYVVFASEEKSDKA